MKTLAKKMDGDWVEIEVTDKEYTEAFEQAKKDLDIQTEAEAEKREDEIEEYIIDYFEDKFEAEYDRLVAEAEDMEDLYRELNHKLNEEQY